MGKCVYCGKPAGFLSRKHKLCSAMHAAGRKNIFYCTEKSVKIPYRKIISLIPYSDGFEIHKDGANAKPFIFENADSWFIINLLASIDI